MEQNKLFGKCPHATAQQVLSGKWSIFILHLLQSGPIRFNELQRQLPTEMTHTTLSRQLKTMEKRGLIVRKEYQQIPPKVEYELSDIGKKFDMVLTPLGEWGLEYIEFMKNKDFEA